MARLPAATAGRGPTYVTVTLILLAGSRHRPARTLPRLRHQESLIGMLPAAGPVSLCLAVSLSQISRQAALTRTHGRRRRLATRTEPKPE